MSSSISRSPFTGFPPVVCPQLPGGEHWARLANPYEGKDAYHHGYDKHEEGSFGRFPGEPSVRLWDPSAAAAGDPTHFRSRVTHNPYEQYEQSPLLPRMDDDLLDRPLMFSRGIPEDERGAVVTHPFGPHRAASPHSSIPHGEAYEDFADFEQVAESHPRRRSGRVSVRVRIHPELAGLLLLGMLAGAAPHSRHSGRGERASARHASHARSKIEIEDVSDQREGSAPPRSPSRLATSSRRQTLALPAPVAEPQSSPVAAAPQPTPPPRLSEAQPQALPVQKSPVPAPTTPPLPVTPPAPEALKPAAPQPEADSNTNDLATTQKEDSCFQKFLRIFFCWPWMLLARLLGLDTQEL